MENQIENEIESENENEAEEASSEEASAAPTAETSAETPAKKKRGRQKGVKVGPRERVWDCAAIDADGELVHARVVAPEGSTLEQRGSFTEVQARTLFADEYGVDAESISILGPYFDQKGAQVTAATKKRETVSIPMGSFKITSNCESAIFKGWQGMAYEIEGRTDAVFFMPGKEINPNPDKKRPAPPAKPVLRSALEFETN